MMIKNVLYLTYKNKIVNNILTVKKIIYKYDQGRVLNKYFFIVTMKSKFQRYAYINYGNNKYNNNNMKKKM